MAVRPQDVGGRIRRREWQATLAVGILWAGLIVAFLSLAVLAIGMAGASVSWWRGVWR